MCHSQETGEQGTQPQGVPLPDAQPHGGTIQWLQCKCAVFRNADNTLVH